MEMGDILFVWYVHNNQLYCNDDVGDQLIQQYTRVGDYMSSIPWQYVLEKMNT